MDSHDEEVTVASVRKLETNARNGGPEAANAIPSLLRILADAADEDQDDQVSMTALHAVRRIFVQMIDQGDLDLAPATASKSSNSSSKKQKKEDAQQVQLLRQYATWLRLQYSSATDVLLDLVRNLDVSGADDAEEERRLSRLQVASLRTLMTFVSRDARARLDMSKTDKNGNATVKDARISLFGTELFAQIVGAALCTTTGQTTRVLVDEFCTYTDVRFHMWKVLREIARSTGKATKATADDSDSDSDSYSDSGEAAQQAGNKRKKKKKNSKKSKKRSRVDSEEEEEEEEQNKGNGLFGWVHEADRSRVALRMLELLSALPAPTEDPDATNLFGHVPDKATTLNSTDTNTTDSKKKKKKKAKRSLPKAADAKLHRRAFEEAWVAFLGVPGLPRGVLRRVLLLLPKDILPNLQHPLLLAEFLTCAYDAGRTSPSGDTGAISLMALESLFILITRHGLDYPNFYARTYALLDPFVFHTQHRSRFFELLDIFLLSTHLPSYLVAAFAKKLLRIALHAPPAAAIFVVPFVHNLLRRHPNCIGLIQRNVADINVESGEVDQTADPTDKLKERAEHVRKIREASKMLAQKRKRPAFDDEEEEEEVEGASNDKKVKRSHATKKAKSKIVLVELAEKRVGSDPFIADEKDPSKCRAIDSSLWELDALAAHYTPTVAGLASRMFKDPIREVNHKGLAKPKAVVPIQDFTECTYRSLFEVELKVRRSKENKMRSVPLAIDAPLPLFALGSGLCL